MVSDYISKSIGPKAVIADLAKTARVMARFGPRLPRLVESALIRQSNPETPVHQPFKRWIALALVLGGVVGGVGVWGLQYLTG